MKVKIRIRQPGTGSANYNQTSFLLKHNRKDSDSVGSINKYGEVVVTSERGNYVYGTKDEDPVFESLSKTLDKMLFIRYGQIKLDELSMHPSSFFLEHLHYLFYHTSIP